MRILTIAFLSLFVSGFAASLSAQAFPDPTGVTNMVRVSGQIVDGLYQEFYDDGTWEMWNAQGLVGWGTWNQNMTTGDISYTNDSPDGGGNQSGTYSWNAESHEWDRTWSSHPNAPSLSLVPPL